MIYDKIENIKKYQGISKWFDAAIAFLKKTDLGTLPLGRTEINEGHVFVNVMEVETKAETEVDFEFHKKYWDLHVAIEGSEKLQIGLEKGNLIEAYREEDDFGTQESGKYLEFVLEKDCFILCMEEELHKPTLINGEKAKIKKCVMKVEVLPVR